MRWVKLIHRDRKYLSSKCGRYIKAASCLCQCSSRRGPFVIPLIMDTMTLLNADDVFLAPHNKVDLEQLVQTWNDHFMKYGLALYGSECWLTIKDIWRSLAGMETKMLRAKWRYHIWNDDIRNWYEVELAKTHYLKLVWVWYLSRWERPAETTMPWDNR